MFYFKDRLYRHSINTCNQFDYILNLTRLIQYIHKKPRIHFVLKVFIGTQVVCSHCNIRNTQQFCIQNITENSDENKSLNDDVYEYTTDNVSYLKDLLVQYIIIIIYRHIISTYTHTHVNALVDKNSRAQSFIFILGKMLCNELHVTITY